MTAMLEALKTCLGAIIDSNAIIDVGQHHDSSIGREHKRSPDARRPPWTFLEQEARES